jgi:L-cysteine/cystine lyase
VALSERVVAEAAPTVIGWRSLRDESKADLNGSDLFHHDSRRFEVATSCVPLMAGLRCSLELLEQQGSAEHRWDSIQTLSSSLWRSLEGLDRVTPLLETAPASGLVSFQINGDVPPAEHVKQLGAQGLWIRDLADPSCLRACTHISTTASEIDALVAAISPL